MAADAPRPSARSSLLRWLGSLAVLALLLLAWQWAARAELLSPVFFPAPQLSFAALGAQLHSTAFWQACASTLLRMLMGFAAATFLGIFLGALIGLRPGLRAWVEPSLELLRPLPASAMLPVFVLLLGLNERMVVAAIVFAALWPVLLNTVQGLKSVEPRLLELARVLHLTRMQVLAKIFLPAALPDIFSGLRLALTVSLILAVVAEMLAGLPGLGQNITLAARAFRSPDLYAGIMVLGLVGYASNAILAACERRWLRWRDDLQDQ